jgi:hypothetical protein
MKKLMLSLFVAFGIGSCTLSNDANNVECGAYKEVALTGFPLLCNYSVKTLPNNPTPVIVDSQEKMDKYFAKHENSCPVASDPNIDFTKNMLVGVFAGIKSTSGYTIKMTSIVENGCGIVINFYESGPQSGENINQTSTYPSDFIIIPKSMKTIVFNRTNESPDNIKIGSYFGKCTGSTCQTFFQLNDFNILEFQDVKAGSYSFEQYKYTTTTKRDEYTEFLKTVPTEILALRGKTKTYGTPDASDQGGIYFELIQGATVTQIFIDNNDTADQSTEVRAFKKAIREKISRLQ